MVGTLTNPVTTTGNLTGFVVTANSSFNGPGTGLTGTAAGLTAENLFRPENESKFLTLFHGHLDLAEAHLAAGWRYTNTLPFSQFRVRLACAWPVLIGLRTLENLRAARVAGLQQRVKITRGEVRGILLRSTLACWLPPLWKKMYSPRAKAVASGNNLA